jgi:dihydroorotate dehydrogenase electron transfer subunit
VAIDEEGFAIRLAPDADRGRAWLRMAPVGAEVDCLGPVGQGFQLPERGQRILCLGQGEGAWALLPLVRAASARGLSVVLAVEATTRRQTIPARDLPLSVEYRVATLDGSAGRRGDLQPQFDELLAWADAVMAAGSHAFYQRLGRAIENTRVLFDRGFAQALYQTDFFCGFGACQACAADVAGGRRRVCLRGPVFDLKDLLR